MEALGKRPHPDTRKQGGGWRILGLVSSARLGYSILVGFGIEPLAIQGGCLWRSAVAPAKACLLFFLFASAAARDGVDLNLDWDLDSVGVQVCVCASLAKLLFAVCLTSALATHRIQFILAETILALKTTIYCRSTRTAGYLLLMHAPIGASPIRFSCSLVCFDMYRTSVLGDEPWILFESDWYWWSNLGTQSWRDPIT